MTLNTSDLPAILEFLREAERLKNVTRNAWTSAGRRESVAEHTWRLALMSLVLRRGFPDVDWSRVLAICLVHDLGEALGGDVPAPLQDESPGKAERERRDLRELLRPLPPAIAEEIAGLWEEYEAAETREARLAKGLDKLETILQHNQGRNPPDFDYRFNLDYGRRFTTDDPLLAALRRLLDEETERRAMETGGGREDDER